MLAEGRGGFMDYGKYRDRLTDIVWRGIMPELTPEEKAEAAKSGAGQPVPESAMDEARALYERSKQLQAAQEK
jgi:hypothetical protein